MKRVLAVLSTMVAPAGRFGDGDTDVVPTFSDGIFKVGDKTFTPEEFAKHYADGRKEFKSVIGDRDSFKKALREKEEAEKLAKDNKAKEQGEFQKLYEELKPQHDTVSKELEGYKGTVQKYLEAEIAGIPEDKRELIPDVPVTQKLEWVINAKSKGLFGETKKGPDVKLPTEGPDAKKFDGMSPVARLQAARKQQAVDKK